MKVSDLPVTPLLALIVGKLIGVIFSSVVFAINLPSLGYNNIYKLLYGMKLEENIVILSSYSDLFMFTVLSTGFIVSLLIYTDKSKKTLDKKHIEDYFRSPVEKTISTAHKLYGSAFRWLIVLWLANVYILYNTLSGRTYLWIYLLIFLLNISLSIYIFLDLKLSLIHI